MRSAAVEQCGGDRRPVGGPAVVGRVHGVVERRGAPRGGGHGVGVGRVDLPVLDRRRSSGRRCGRAPARCGRARPVPRPSSYRPGPCRRSRAVPWRAPRCSDESGALVRDRCSTRRACRLSRALLSLASSALDPASWRHDLRPRARPHRADGGDHRRRPPPAGRGRARPALSLRAVAREVGMVSSAVYRYFPSRDDLLTRLIIDGYDDLGAAAEAADDPARGPRRALAGGLPGGARLGAAAPARVRAALRLPRARLPGAEGHRPGRLAGRHRPGPDPRRRRPQRRAAPDGRRATATRR